MITDRITDDELKLFAAEPKNNLALMPNHAMTQKMAAELLALRHAAAELVEVSRAGLEYIDAIPVDTASRFETMPGFGRDWAEDTISEARRLLLNGKP
ncbi:hypothetical protein [Pantoea sp. Acro-807]|uniref:hypothetical protein n=1 Tax=Pantoea sp. Acro-807 TaxID=2608356 RepID=UPI001FFDD951|nr:hypothetical protein [Pantoea sp. Acro-807]